MPKFIRRKKTVEVVLKSYWPIWTRRLFESLREIPWLPLTAAGTLLGGVVLSLYFDSINYSPTDLSALIGLGAATAVFAIGIYGVLAIGLFAPATLYRSYLLEVGGAGTKPKRTFSEMELVGLQLGGVGMVYGVSAYPAIHDCGDWLTRHSVIALIATLFWAGALARVLWIKNLNQPRFEICNTAAGIAVFSAILPFVLLPILPLLESEYFDTTIIFLTLWGIAICVNASAAEKLPVLALTTIGGLLVLVLFIALPLAMGNASMFPQIVANAMGVRQDQSQEFRLPTRTCLLIQSGLAVSSNRNVSCGTGEWSAVKMQVLSNVGEHWFVEVQSDTTSGNTGASLRMSIPRADIHLVQSPEIRSARQVSIACRA